MLILYRVETKDARVVMEAMMRKDEKRIQYNSIPFEKPIV